MNHSQEKCVPEGLMVSKLINTEQTKMLNQKVFNNDLILDCIFGFSNLEDIKCFRQVCCQWNRVAIPFLKKLSLIIFRKPNYSSEHFKQLFGFSDLGRDFTRVKLTYHPSANEDCEWELNEFTEFLKARRVKMTELTIEKIMLRGVPSRTHFDLSPHIGPNLTKLHITGFTLLTISTDCCSSTKFLTISGCRLMITNGIKINPVELTLYDVDIRRNGNIKVLSINELVNFDRLNYLSLQWCNSGGHGYPEDSGRTLSCHFRDLVTVERVDLCGEKINLDFKNAKWKITKKFSLSCADFVEPNEMKISNFEFKNGSLQLAVLPRNVRKLKLAKGSTHILRSEHIHLPELEILNFFIYRYILSEYQFRYMSRFSKCENLINVMLIIPKENPYNPPNPPCVVDIATFPKSVKKLYICGDIGFCGESPSFYLKQLHLKCSKQNSLNSILSTFKGQELVVDLRGHLYSSDSLHRTVMDISQKPFAKILVALNHCDSQEGNNFITCPLSEITNEISGFYIFANGFGTVIQKSTFESIFKYWEEINQD